MIELTAAEAGDLIDTWAGIVQATTWADAPVLSDRGPTTVLVSISKTAAKAAAGDATIIGWFDIEQRLHLDTGTEVFTLYPGAP